MRQVGLGVILREQSFYHVTNVIIKNDAIVSKKRTITFPPLIFPLSTHSNPFLGTILVHASLKAINLILEQKTNDLKNSPALVPSGGNDT